MCAPSTTSTRPGYLRGQGIHCLAPYPHFPQSRGHPEAQGATSLLPLPSDLGTGPPASPPLTQAGPSFPLDPGQGCLPRQTQGRPGCSLTCSAGSGQPSAQTSGGSRCPHRSGFLLPAVMPHRAASGAQLPARPQSLWPVLHLRMLDISGCHRSWLDPSPPTSLGGKLWVLPILQMEKLSQMFQSSPLLPIPSLEVFIPSSKWVPPWFCLRLPICAVRALSWPSWVDIPQNQLSPDSWMDRHVAPLTGQQHDQQDQGQSTTRRSVASDHGRVGPPGSPCLPTPLIAQRSEAVGVASYLAWTSPLPPPHFGATGSWGSNHTPGGCGSVRLRVQTPLRV